MPDPQVLPAVHVDTVEKLPGIGSRHPDLAERRGIEQRDTVARSEAFAPHRRRHIFLGARIIASALPLADILEHRARRDVPLMHRGHAYRVGEMTSCAAGEETERDRYIGRAEGGRGGVADVAPG